MWHWKSNRLNLSFFSRRSKRTVRRSRSQWTNVAAEVFEERRLLSAAAAPAWSQATALTISFVPDGTSAAGQSSQLFQALGQLDSTPNWQQSILDAFQTWASQANINFGLVADNGADLGTAGLMQHDSRFGDIRIAAVPMGADVMAMAVPASSSLTGTWTGDILINSNATFSGLDQLFAVMLHEAGHVLGLPESSDPNSPLYDSAPATGANLPTPSDIQVLQQMYGLRPTTADQAGTLTNPTPVALPRGYSGSTPLLAYASLNSVTDVDVFAVAPPAAASGPVTFQVRTAGVSQLQARLSVYDDQGNLLGQTSGESGEDLSLTLDGTSTTSRYLLQIDSPSGGIDGVGTYAVVASFDDLNQVAGSLVDAAVLGGFTNKTPTQLQQYFLTGALPAASSDDHEALQSTPGFAPNTDYVATGAINTAGDDVEYTIQAPTFASGQSIVLTVGVQATSQGGLLPTVEVTDLNGNVMPSQVLMNGLGSYVVQVSGILSGQQYEVEVEGAKKSSPLNSVGGFQMHAQFGTPAPAATPALSGTLTSAAPVQYHQVSVASTGLTQFGLSATGSGSSSRQVLLQLSVFDASGNLVYQLTGTPGSLKTADPVLMNQGNYLIAVNAIAVSGSLPSQLRFAVYGAMLSDPIGPALASPRSMPPTGTKPGIPNPQPLSWSTSISLTKPPTLPAPKSISSPTLGWTSGIPKLP